MNILGDKINIVILYIVIYNIVIIEYSYIICFICHTIYSYI